MRCRLGVITMIVCLLAVVGGRARGAPQPPAFHGVAFSKGCVSPVQVGGPYTCEFQIQNTVDTAQDSLRVTGLSDTVSSALGDVSSGNILATVGLVFSGSVSCSGGSGAGTAADPYVGATQCL